MTTLSSVHQLYDRTSAKLAATPAVRAVDRYTSPRPTTGADQEETSLFLAGIEGAASGFAILGPAGLVAGAAAAVVGAQAEHATHNRLEAALTGAATGAALGAATSLVTGGAAAPLMVAGGALIGAFRALDTDPNPTTRDAGTGATTISSLMLGGPAAFAAGVASAVGAGEKTTGLKMALGGATGAALGAALALTGVAAGPLVGVALAVGALGAVGPLVGPRLMQGIRNLSDDGLHLLHKVLPHREKAAPTHRTSNFFSLLPALVTRELNLNPGDLVRAAGTVAGQLPNIALDVARHL